jgi:hypothetical protein
MHGDYQGVVPLSPLDGAAGAKYAFVAAGQYEFHEALERYETDGQNEKSAGAHTEPQMITGAKS